MHLDCQDNDTPHWCLWTQDDGGQELIFEALGSTGHAFRYHTRSVIMASSKSEKKQIKIGRIEADVWPEIPDLLAGVPMSTQSDWNCQNWVMEAITALKKVNYLEEDDSGLTYVQGKYKSKKRAY